MRELAGDLRWLSLNWATVRERCDLGHAIAGCAHHGIPAIAPWREPLQAMGVGATARLIREHGLTVSGLCRAGMSRPPPPPAGRGRSTMSGARSTRRRRSAPRA